MILRASVMTMHDVRFSEEGSGINVCCMNSVVDPWKVYGAVLSKSDRLTSFMQQDTLTMNLGYVTNAGTTKRCAIIAIPSQRKSFYFVGKELICQRMIFSLWRYL